MAKVNFLKLVLRVLVALLPLAKTLIVDTSPDDGVDVDEIVDAVSNCIRLINAAIE